MIRFNIKPFKCLAMVKLQAKSLVLPNTKTQNEQQLLKNWKLNYI